MRLLLVAIACCLGAASNASAADIKSISRLAAGPENVLFVADWKSARVHAITLPGAAQKPAGTAFNILDLEDASLQAGRWRKGHRRRHGRPSGNGGGLHRSQLRCREDAGAYRGEQRSAGSPRRPQGGEVDLDSASRRAHVELQVLEGNARAKLYGDRHEMARWGALHRRPFEPGLCFDPATDQVPVRFAAVDHVGGDLSHGSQPDRDARPDPGDELRDAGRQALPRGGLHVHARS